ncbi:MAG: hypothetical protein J1E40_09825, partial [Oscillospiraceae bacterium]|nr:hypothetical protein [Oscillospiraceae bacterium]
ERNDELLGFILHKVAQYTVREWVSQSSEDATYIAFGQIEDTLFIEQVSQLLIDTFKSYSKDVHSKSNIGALLSNLVRFLAEDFFCVHESFIRNVPYLTPQQVDEQIQALFNMAFSVKVHEDITWVADYQCVHNLLCKMEQNLQNGRQVEWNKIDAMLPPLVYKMALDVEQGHWGHIMLAAQELVMKLRSYSVDEEFSKQALNIEDLVDSLIVDICSTKNIFACSAEETDHWIETIYTKVANYNKGILSECRTLAIRTGEAEQATFELELLLENLKYTIFDCLRTIKDCNQLYRWLIDGQTGRIKYNRRNKLLEQIHSLMRLRLREKFHNKASHDWLLLSAPRVQALIAPLGNDLEQGDLFNDSLNKVLCGISRSTIDALVNESAILYREAFADLGMCVSLQLKVLGYLRVLANNDSVCRECRSNTKASLDLERLSLVCQVLIAHDSEFSEETFRQACVRYLNNVIDAVDKKLDLNKLPFDMWTFYCNHLTNILKYSVQFNGVLVMPLLNNDLQAHLLSEHKLSCEALYQLLQVLWNTIHFAQYILERLNDRRPHFLREHCDELYRLISKERNSNSFWQEDILKIFTKVGDYYNNADMAVEFELKERGEFFKDTLSFVLSYYYLSWNKYEQFYPINRDYEPESGMQTGGT